MRGYRLNPVTHRAELTSISKVLTNSTTLVTFPHVLFGAFLTGGVFLIGVSAWHLARKNDTVLFGKAMRYGLVVSLIAAIGVSVSGDLQARIMTKQQPMKMAAAEALYTTSAPASFSLFTIGSLDGGRELWSVRAPNVLSFMATGDPNGKVEGIDDLQKAYEAEYGAGSYKPVVPVTYWSFRLMIGFGFLAGLLALAGLWSQRRGNRWFYRAALASMALPFLANMMGWIFTEIGRQPWTVFGVLRTKDGVSPGVGLGSVATSLTVFTLLYAVLAVIAGALMVRYVRSGPPSEEETATEDPLPAFSY